MTEANTTRILAGRCECRAVRYEVPDEFLYAANCHCSHCRASTGPAFKPFAGPGLLARDGPVRRIELGPVAPVRLPKRSRQVSTALPTGAGSCPTPRGTALGRFRLATRDVRLASRRLWWPAC